jgi:hypothetical protein
VGREFSLDAGLSRDDVDLFLNLAQAHLQVIAK